MRVSCLCGIILAAIMVSIPVSIHAQTYDTPSTLIVQMTHPNYMYVDDNGHTVMTGMIQNESEQTYVGNIVILVRFYDDTSETPLYKVMSEPLLQVIPPQSASPFSVRSPQPDTRISDATATMLIFEQSNPKVTGFDIHIDSTTGHIAVSDAAHAPHTNVTVHVSYRDVFEPPRILYTQTFHLGDMEMDGTLYTNAYGNMPYNTRSVAVYAESDVFSSKAAFVTISNVVPYPHSTTHITDVWVKDDTHTETTRLSLHQNVTLGADIHLDTDEPHWVYVQIKRQDQPAVVFLEGTTVQSPDDIVSIPWSPSSVGDYIMEVFLWGNLDIPITAPSPIVLFSVE